MTLEIQVVICTHNGARRLPRVLAALARQTLAADRWSVLVVDNASTDDTGQCGHGWSSRAPFRVVRERRPGLAHARRRAHRETEGEFLCFCDDDNELAPDYLAAALEVMRAQPAAGVLGGHGELACESVPPPWFGRALDGYAVGSQLGEAGDVPLARGYVHGAGMVVRRAAWSQLIRSGFISHLLGREGARLNSGEDNEFCLALRLLGWRVHYSPRLRFRHLIAAHRLDEKYCRALYRSFGESMTVLNVYRDFLLRRATPSCWWHCAAGRVLQSAAYRLRGALRAAPALPLEAGGLAREFAAGRLASYRRALRRGELFPLYGEIATWLAHAPRGSAA